MFQKQLLFYSLYFYFRLIDESFRWLLANNKTDQAEKILRKAARWNKKQYNEILDPVGNKGHSEYDKLQTAAGYECQENDKTKNGLELHADDTERRIIQFEVDHELGDTDEVKQYSILTIFRSRRLFFISVTMWFAWYGHFLFIYNHKKIKDLKVLRITYPRQTLIFFFVFFFSTLEPKAKII